MRIRPQWSWLLAAASVVVPIGAVLWTLSYQNGFWIIAGLAGGAAVSVLLVELAAGDQYPGGTEPQPGPARGVRGEPSVTALDVYGKRVDALPASERR